MPAYTDMSYDKLLLDSLRLVSYEPGNGVLTTEGLVRATTMNENLKTLGYTLNPQDLIRIAQSPSVDRFYEHVKEQMSDVKAKPMYPDFPTQVMDIDEAQYRMHQLIHYFSTYELEDLTGIEVSEGWLPAKEGFVSDTEKTQTDSTLLSAKVIELISEREKYTRPFEDILGKRERMTDMEREIVKRCAESGKLKFNRKITVPFKENLKDTFMVIATAGAEGAIPRKEAAEMLFNICQHPGDVTRNLHDYLAKNRYNLRTSEKKMFVSLYEKFDNRAFKENLIVPRSKEKFTKEIFQHISFTKYAKNSEKIKAVREIGQTRTWEAKARDMITSHDPDAIKFTAQRPGMLIRMTSMALRNGYSEEEIARELSKKSTEISAQTLVSQIYATRKGPTNDQSVGAKKARQALAQEIQSIDKAKKALSEKERKNFLDMEERKKFLLEREETFGYTIGSVWPGGKVSLPSEKKINVRTAMQNRSEKLKEKISRIDEKETERIKERNNTYAAQDRIFTAVLKDRLEKINTGLEGKTVCIDTLYDIGKMPLDPAHKKMSQGYLPPAVMKIPEGVDRIRCFVYWNDRHRVDLDLHAYAKSEDGKQMHVGWDADFRNSGICSSGDITHSNAAEYIDIDLNKAKEMVVDLQLHSFTGEHFLDIDTCFAGIMAVDQIGKEVKLYDPKNCFASMDITNNSTNISVAELDTKERTISFSCKDKERGFSEKEQLPPFSIKDYVELVVEAGGGKFTEDPEKADVIITLTKPASEKEVSLIKTNYFFGVMPEMKQDMEKTLQEDMKKEPAQPIFETSFTKAFILECTPESVGGIFDRKDKRPAVVKNPNTGEMFLVDKDNPRGTRIEGNNMIKTVMDLEERAIPKDYRRVIELSGIREQLKDAVTEAERGFGINLPGKETNTLNKE